MELDERPTISTPRTGEAAPFFVHSNHSVDKSCTMSTIISTTSSPSNSKKPSQQDYQDHPPFHQDDRESSSFDVDGFFKQDDKPISQINPSSQEQEQPRDASVSCSQPTTNLKKRRLDLSLDPNTKKTEQGLCAPTEKDKSSSLSMQGECSETGNKPIADAAVSTFTATTIADAADADADAPPPPPFKRQRTKRAAQPVGGATDTNTANIHPEETRKGEAPVQKEKVQPNISSNSSHPTNGNGNNNGNGNSKRKSMTKPKSGEEKAQAILKANIPPPSLPGEIRVKRANMLQDTVYSINEESFYILLRRPLFLSFLGLATKILTPFKVQNNILFYIDVDPNKPNGFERREKAERQVYEMGFRSSENDTSIFTEVHVSSQHFDDIYCPNSLCLILQQDALSRLYKNISSSNAITADYVLLVVQEAFRDASGCINSNWIDILTCNSAPMTNPNATALESYNTNDTHPLSSSSSSSSSSAVLKKLQIEQSISLKIAGMIPHKTQVHGFPPLSDENSLSIELKPVSMSETKSTTELEKILILVDAKPNYSKTNASENTRRFFFNLEHNNLYGFATDGQAITTKRLLCNFVDHKNRLKLDKNEINIMFSADRILSVLKSLPEHQHGRLVLRIPFGDAGNPEEELDEEDNLQTAAGYGGALSLLNAESSEPRITFVSFEARHDFGRLVISVATKETNKLE